MKIRHMVVALVPMVSVMGCTDLHDDPIGLLTPEQINTDPTLNTVTSSVTSSYQMLANTLNMLNEWRWELGTVFRSDIVLQDMAGDEMRKKWTGPDSDQPWMDQVEAFNFTADNPGFNGVWTFDYEGITRANLAISYLTDAAVITRVGMSPADRDRRLGEAYFLRAFYYFDLVNNFGDVPLLTEPLTSFQEAYAAALRAPKADVWAQISEDLANAKDLLPNTKYSDAAEKWRASKGAAVAMQAKVALYNDRWSDVVTIVTELEGLGFYSLNANYFDSFAIASEFAENEVIFAFDHQRLQNPKKGNGISAPLSWGFIAPTADFLAEFEANDPRLAYTVNVPDKLVYKLLGTTDNTWLGNDDAPGNKIYIRFADVLLWKAEAHNELAQYSQAIAIINQIRTRARTSLTIAGTTPPPAALPNRPASTNKAEIIGWLMHERQVELGFESQRFNDLKRWGIAKEVLVALGKNFQDHNYLYPIPQSEIDRSGRRITQNDGY